MLNEYSSLNAQDNLGGDIGLMCPFFTEVKNKRSSTVCCFPCWKRRVVQVSSDAWAEHICHSSVTLTHLNSLAEAITSPTEPWIDWRSTSALADGHLYVHRLKTNTL